MMKPFGRNNLPEPEKIFNYRLSRAKQIVENAFRILGNRFQCLLTMLRQEPDVVCDIVLTCICLHNLMRIRYPGPQNAVMDQEDNNLIVTMEIGEMALRCKICLILHNFHTWYWLPSVRGSIWSYTPTLLWLLYHGSRTWYRQLSTTLPVFLKTTKILQKELYNNSCIYIIPMF